MCIHSRPGEVITGKFFAVFGLLSGLTAKYILVLRGGPVCPPASDCRSTKGAHVGALLPNITLSTRWKMVVAPFMGAHKHRHKACDYRVLRGVGDFSHPNIRFFSK